tara:strand:+ start:45044 stop:45556 length:513 start_codon:yes stop_codon:yes gene_type:complete
MRIIITLSFFALVLGCASSPKIEFDRDSSYNLSNYSSFTIKKPILREDLEIDINPILIQRVERSLKQALQSKGLKESKESDMIVHFLIGSEREVERSSDLGGYGFYNNRYSYARDQRYIRTEKDVISIRFHDSKTNEVIWYAFTRINRSLNIKDQDSINNLVALAIENFN